MLELSLGLETWQSLCIIAEPPAKKFQAEIMS
jgi:hypothetical protein